MKALSDQKKRFVDANRREFGDSYDALSWVTGAQARAAAQERERLLSALQGMAAFSCKNTKVDARRLSPGCQICSQGRWSCLFINGRCNCRCFYCPTRQDHDDEPITNTAPFPDVSDYIDYIRKLGFTGMSVSGGEPLLTLDKSLLFLQTVKNEFGDSVYTWLYTNGTLASRDALQKLQAAGLDEIRFDIGAAGMSLEAVKRAADVIDAVTVEIPALPEQFDAMKTKIDEMEKAGVKHLNLHQLRLTPHNLPHLAKRNYTFLHGERVTVLESELTALRLIHWSLSQGRNLPINYCSFVYKHRFQRSAARRKSAAFIAKPFEDVTENGYIRTLDIIGDSEALGLLIEDFRLRGMEERCWSLNSRRDRLSASVSLWRNMDFSRFQVAVSYSEAKILPAITYRNPFVTLPLNSRRNLYVERIPVSGKNLLDRDLAERLHALVTSGSAPRIDNASNPVWGKILSFELIEEGLADYG
ncbi:MAG: radical SAM protein [Candidatus Omnitrophica bacterium]|nr:radical SAM protein [Candidatus Omnitrophota bacterium]